MAKKKTPTKLKRKPATSKETPRRGDRTKLRRVQNAEKITENEEPPLDLEPDGKNTRNRNRNKQRIEDKQPAKKKPTPSELIVLLASSSEEEENEEFQDTVENEAENEKETDAVDEAPKKLDDDEDENEHQDPEEVSDEEKESPDPDEDDEDVKSYQRLTEQEIADIEEEEDDDFQPWEAETDLSKFLDERAEQQLKNKRYFEYTGKIEARNLEKDSRLDLRDITKHLQFTTEPPEEDEDFTHDDNDDTNESYSSDAIEVETVEQNEEEEATEDDDDDEKTTEVSEEDDDVDMVELVGDSNILQPSYADTVKRNLKLPPPNATASKNLGKKSIRYSLSVNLPSTKKPLELLLLTLRDTLKLIQVYMKGDIGIAVWNNSEGAKEGPVIIDPNDIPDGSKGSKDKQTLHTYFDLWLKPKQRPSTFRRIPKSEILHSRKPSKTDVPSI